MPALRVSELFIYPIKSLAGIPVKSVRVLKKGLEHDRRWMLIDESNTFLTQRVHTRMALFRTSLTNGAVVVRFGDEEIKVPFGKTHGHPLTAKIWDDTVTVVEVAADLSAWFSKHLGIACRLVAFPEENARPVDPQYRLADDHVSLADAYPLLVIGQSSLDDLNNRLKQPVPMNRFRPNIVYTGGDPFDEDFWTSFSIGQMKLAAVKPCKRCVLITVDQETGVKGTEPLATLSTYRKRDNGVYFGQNVIPIKAGQISIEDEINLE